MIAFTLSSDFAMFRKPYTTVSPISFPAPNVGALRGIIGSIIGKDTDEIEGHIAVLPIKPAERITFTLNVIGLKDWKMTRVQFPYSFLQNPAFRLYYTGPHEEQLFDYLKSNKTVYPVTLGPAYALATISDVASVSYEVTYSKEIHSVLYWPSNSELPKISFENIIKTEMDEDIVRTTGDRFIMIYSYFPLCIEDEIQVWKITEDVVINDDALYLYPVKLNSEEGGKQNE